MVTHGTIQLISVEVVAAEQRRRRNQRAVDKAEETEMTVDVQVGLRLQEEVLQEALLSAPGHPKVLGIVAEAADGDIQEGKPQELHLREVQGPLSVHGLSADITCWGSASVSRETANFGIPTLPLLQER